MELGSALAVTSLVFQLLGGCIKGFVLLSGAHNIGKVGTALLCLLSIQELRLTEWAKRAGLLGDTGTLDPRINSLAVEVILTQLNEILNDVEQLSKRYKMSLSTTRPADAQEDGTDTVELLGIAVSTHTRRDILRRAKHMQDGNILPKRMWWAAVDRDKFKDMVADVRVYVQELWNLLDPVTQDEMLRNQQLMLSQVISLTDRLEDVRSIQDALGTLSVTSGTFGNYMPLASIAAVKAARLEGEDSTSETPQVVAASVTKPTVHSDSNRPVEILDSEVTDFQRMPGRDDLGFAHYHEQNVLVECKDLQPENRLKLVKRVQQLAHVLHVPKSPSFRSLHCVGVAMNDSMTKAAFVFELPQSQTAHPVSLRDLLGGKTGLTAPSVGARIKLALELLQSTQCFHTAGWMHKNLRSENILFITEDVSSASRHDDERLNMPYIVGFAFARLDAPGQISEKPSDDPSRDIYRHPHALSGVSEFYQRFMDLYSLGTILVELAEWRPLSTLVREVVDVKKDAIPMTQLAGVRNYLCQAACHSTGSVKLDFRMGKRYARAARLCLGAETMDGALVARGLTSSQPDQALDILNAAVEELRGCVI